LQNGVLEATCRSINRLSAEHRLPTVYTASIYAAEGGLISYGSDIPDMFRRGALYVDHIFRSAKVNELPVEWPIRSKLVVNLCRRDAIEYYSGCGPTDTAGPTTRVTPLHCNLGHARSMGVTDSPSTKLKPSRLRPSPGDCINNCYGRVRFSPDRNE
jgi:hypothetical protein